MDPVIWIDMLNENLINQWYREHESPLVDGIWISLVRVVKESGSNVWFRSPQKVGLQLVVGM